MRRPGSITSATCPVDECSGPFSASLRLCGGVAVLRPRVDGAAAAALHLAGEDGGGGVGGVAALVVLQPADDAEELGSRERLLRARLRVEVHELQLADGVAGVAVADAHHQPALD